MPVVRLSTEFLDDHVSRGFEIAEYPDRTCTKRGTVLHMTQEEIDELRSDAEIYIDPCFCTWASLRRSAARIVKALEEHKVIHLLMADYSDFMPKKKLDTHNDLV